MSSSFFKPIRDILTKPISKESREKARKLLSILTVITKVNLALLLLILLLLKKESTLFPLSLKARDWTGFGGGTTEQATTSIEKAPNGKIIKTVVTSKKEDSKTLWDWLSVLGVPLTLTLLGVLFQIRQQIQADKKADSEKIIANAKADLEKEIAEIARKEEVIQAYLDKLSDLLIDKNLIAIAAKIKDFGGNTKFKEGYLPEHLQEQKEQLDAAVDVIRARTLGVLRRLKDDSERKSSVVGFLIEAEVIGRLNLSLKDVDLSGVDLSGANLSGANLCNTDLSGANLYGTTLKYAKFNGAILVATDLRMTQGLNRKQLEGEEKPFLCNVALPKDFNDLQNRDCDYLPEKLQEQYPKIFKTLEDAKDFVSIGIQKKWD